MTSLVRKLISMTDGSSRWMRIWKFVGAVSVRTKIMGIVLTLTVLLGVVVTLQVRVVMRNVFLSELDNRGASVASDLAARSVDPILLNDNYALYELLNATVRNHPDVLYAYIVSPQEQVLVHTFGEAGFPVDLLTAVHTGVSQSLNDNVTRRQFRTDEGIVHDFAAPIFGGRSGEVHLGMTETRLLGIVNAVTGQMLLTTLAVALAGIMAAIFLTWLLTRPILSLVETTKQVGKGDLSARASHWADDEIGMLADAFNHMVQELELSRINLAEEEAARRRLLEKLILAQEDERKRIARELHDGVGQALTSLTVGMLLLNQAEDREQLTAQTQALSHTARETLEQVRLLGRQLRPSVLDDLGLGAALQRYREEFVRLYPGIAVDLHCDLPLRMDPVIETALYRIIQEGMTNAARHSECSTVSVLISRRADHVQVIIEDDGRGFDPLQERRQGRSVGIHGMQERAELIGGRLVIESGQDGTTIYVDVDLSQGEPP